MGQYREECGQTELLHADSTLHQQGQFELTSGCQNDPCHCKGPGMCQPRDELQGQMGDIWIVCHSFTKQNQDLVWGEFSTATGVKGLE